MSQAPRRAPRKGVAQRITLSIVPAAPAPTPAPTPTTLVPLPVNAVAQPQLGSFGVLVMMLDTAPSRRSTEALGRLAPGWRGEVVFLSTLQARAGTPLFAQFPGLFYNVGEPLQPAKVWRLLPWRAVVAIKAGRVSCWSPDTDVPPSNPLKKAK